MVVTARRRVSQRRLGELAYEACGWDSFEQVRGVLTKHSRATPCQVALKTVDGCSMEGTHTKYT